MYSGPSTGHSLERTPPLEESILRNILVPWMHVMLHLSKGHQLDQHVKPVWWGLFDRRDHVTIRGGTTAQIDAVLNIPVTPPRPWFYWYIFNMYSSPFLTGTPLPNNSVLITDVLWWEGDLHTFTGLPRICVLYRECPLRDGSLY